MNYIFHNIYNSFPNIVLFFIRIFLKNGKVFIGLYLYLTLYKKKYYININKIYINKWTKTKL